MPVPPPTGGVAPKARPAAAIGKSKGVSKAVVGGGKKAPPPPAALSSNPTTPPPPASQEGGADDGDAVAAASPPSPPTEAMANTASDDKTIDDKGDSTTIAGGDDASTSLPPTAAASGPKRPPPKASAAAKGKGKVLIPTGGVQPSPPSDKTAAAEAKAAAVDGDTREEEKSQQEVTPEKAKGKAKKGASSAETNTSNDAEGTKKSKKRKDDPTAADPNTEESQQEAEESKETKKDRKKTKRNREEDVSAPPTTTSSSTTTTFIDPLSPETLTMKDRLTRMFQYYAPEKLENLDQLLKNAKGKDDVLLKRLIEKYGPEPRLDPPKSRSEVKKELLNNSNNGGGKDTASSTTKGRPLTAEEAEEVEQRRIAKLRGKPLPTVADEPGTFITTVAKVVNNITGEKDKILSITNKGLLYLNSIREPHVPAIEIGNSSGGGDSKASPSQPPSSTATATDSSPSQKKRSSSSTPSANKIIPLSGLCQVWRQDTYAPEPEGLMVADALSRISAGGGGGGGVLSGGGVIVLGNEDGKPIANADGGPSPTTTTTTSISAADSFPSSMPSSSLPSSSSPQYQLTKKEYIAVAKMRDDHLKATAHHFSTFVLQLDGSGGGGEDSNANTDNHQPPTANAHEDEDDDDDDANNNNFDDDPMAAMEAEKAKADKIAKKKAKLEQRQREHEEKLEAQKQANAGLAAVIPTWPFLVLKIPKQDVELFQFALQRVYLIQQEEAYYKSQLVLKIKDALRKKKDKAIRDIEEAEKRREFEEMRETLLDEKWQAKRDAIRQEKRLAREQQRKNDQQGREEEREERGKKEGASDASAPPSSSDNSSADTSNDSSSGDDDDISSISSVDDATVKKVLRERQQERAENGEDEEGNGDTSKKAKDDVPFYQRPSLLSAAVGQFVAPLPPASASSDPPDDNAAALASQQLSQLPQRFAPKLLKIIHTNPFTSDPNIVSIAKSRNEMLAKELEAAQQAMAKKAAAEQARREEEKAQRKEAKKRRKNRRKRGSGKATTSASSSASSSEEDTYDGRAVAANKSALLSPDALAIEAMLKKALEPTSVPTNARLEQKIAGIKSPSLMMSLRRSLQHPFGGHETEKQRRAAKKALMERYVVDEAPLRQRLVDFLRIVKPSLVAEGNVFVDAMIGLYRGKEQLLFDDLCAEFKREADLEALKMAMEVAKIAAEDVENIIAEDEDKIEKALKRLQGEEDRARRRAEKDAIEAEKRAAEEEKERLAKEAEEEARKAEEEAERLKNMAEEERREAEIAAFEAKMDEDPFVGWAESEKFQEVAKDPTVRRALNVCTVLDGGLDSGDVFDVEGEIPLDEAIDDDAPADVVRKGYFDALAKAERIVAKKDKRIRKELGDEFLQKLFNNNTTTNDDGGASADDATNENEKAKAALSMRLDAEVSDLISAELAADPTSLDYVDWVDPSDATDPQHFTNHPSFDKKRGLFDFGFLRNANSKFFVGSTVSAVNNTNAAATDAVEGEGGGGGDGFEGTAASLSTTHPHLLLQSDRYRIVKHSKECNCAVLLRAFGKAVFDTFSVVEGPSPYLAGRVGKKTTGAEVGEEGRSEPSTTVASSPFYSLRTAESLRLIAPKPRSVGEKGPAPDGSDRMQQYYYDQQRDGGDEGGGGGGANSKDKSSSFAKGDALLSSILINASNSKRIGREEATKSASESSPAEEKEEEPTELAKIIEDGHRQHTFHHYDVPETISFNLLETVIVGKENAVVGVKDASTEEHVAKGERLTETTRRDTTFYEKRPFAVAVPNNLHLIMPPTITEILRYRSRKQKSPIVDNYHHFHNEHAVPLIIEQHNGDYSAVDRRHAEREDYYSLFPEGTKDEDIRWSLGSLYYEDMRPIRVARPDYDNERHEEEEEENAAEDDDDEEGSSSTSNSDDDDDDDSRHYSGDGEDSDVGVDGRFTCRTLDVGLDRATEDDYFEGKERDPPTALMLIRNGAEIDADNKDDDDESFDSDASNKDKQDPHWWRLAKTIDDQLFLHNCDKVNALFKTNRLDYLRKRLEVGEKAFAGGVGFVGDENDDDDDAALINIDLSDDDEDRHRSSPNTSATKERLKKKKPKKMKLVRRPTAGGDANGNLSSPPLHREEMLPGTDPFLLPTPTEADPLLSPHYEEVWVEATDSSDEEDNTIGDEDDDDMDDNAPGKGLLRHLSEVRQIDSTLKRPPGVLSTPKKAGGILSKIANALTPNSKKSPNYADEDGDDGVITIDADGNPVKTRGYWRGKGNHHRHTDKPTKLTDLFASGNDTRQQGVANINNNKNRSGIVPDGILIDMADNLLSLAASNMVAGVGSSLPSPFYDPALKPLRSVLRDGGHSGEKEGEENEAQKSLWPTPLATNAAVVPSLPSPTVFDPRIVANVAEVALLRQRIKQAIADRNAKGSEDKKNSGREGEGVSIEKGKSVSSDAILLDYDDTILLPNTTSHRQNDDDDDADDSFDIPSFITPYDHNHERLDVDPALILRIAEANAPRRSSSPPSVSKRERERRAAAGGRVGAASPISFRSVSSPPPPALVGDDDGSSDDSGDYDPILAPLPAPRPRSRYHHHPHQSGSHRTASRLPPLPWKKTNSSSPAFSTTPLPLLQGGEFAEEEAPLSDIVGLKYEESVYDDDDDKTTTATATEIDDGNGRMRRRVREESPDDILDQLLKHTNTTVSSQAVVPPPPLTTRAFVLGANGKELPLPSSAVPMVVSIPLPFPRSSVVPPPPSFSPLPPPPTLSSADNFPDATLPLPLSPLFELSVPAWVVVDEGGEIGGGETITIAKPTSVLLEQQDAFEAVFGGSGDGGEKEKQNGEDDDAFDVVFGDGGSHSSPPSLPPSSSQKTMRAVVKQYHRVAVLLSVARGMAVSRSADTVGRAAKKAMVVEENNEEKEMLTGEEKRDVLDEALGVVGGLPRRSTVKTPTLAPSSTPIFAQLKVAHNTGLMCASNDDQPYPSPSSPSSSASLLPLLLILTEPQYEKLSVLVKSNNSIATFAHHHANDAMSPQFAPPPLPLPSPIGAALGSLHGGGGSMLLVEDDDDDDEVLIGGKLVPVKKEKGRTKHQNEGLADHHENNLSGKHGDGRGLLPSTSSSPRHFAVECEFAIPLSRVAHVNTIVGNNGDTLAANASLVPSNAAPAVVFRYALNGGVGSLRNTRSSIDADASSSSSAPSLPVFVPIADMSSLRNTIVLELEEEEGCGGGGVMESNRNRPQMASDHSQSVKKALTIQFEREEMFALWEKILTTVIVV